MPFRGRAAQLLLRSGFTTVEKKSETRNGLQKFSRASRMKANDIGLVEKICRLYLLASQKRDWLPTRDLVVDAHQPTA